MLPFLIYSAPSIKFQFMFQFMFSINLQNWRGEEGILRWPLFLSGSSEGSLHIQRKLNVEIAITSFASQSPIMTFSIFISYKHLRYISRLMNFEHFLWTFPEISSYLGFGVAIGASDHHVNLVFTWSINDSSISDLKADGFRLDDGSDGNLCKAIRVNFFRGFKFSLAWWAYTFPMTGAAIATIRCVLLLFS
ncbi:putative S-type anion channel, voltage-dependent anion channel superfamily [Helianthus annuus]|uniref:S-type anion channel, voltage-dependent anion channel superfamily n=1 Tax=Helianthus annuus TaxID=4232 RepID=A0A9K3JSS1_HELAN|nr:putative S-type anion channel, voltage-dependent anion channel superfamily [Helianthus annuus]